ncbi:MAG TPA: VOC family protein [Alphaproteobacteria bacterium]|nr:VOC family protein [Alphaproteobacteria bacterium]
MTRRNALQIFHVNVNCSDLDRSLAFYKLIGFHEFLDLAAAEKDGPRSFGEIGLGPLFRLPDNIDGRAVFLQLGDGKWETRLDLIEWTAPRSEKPSERTLSHLGVARICLKVRDCFALYDKLKTGGYDVYSEPGLIDMAGTRQYVFCCEDPDGVVIEFMQIVKS